MNKRIVSALLALCLTLGFAGCKGGDDADTPVITEVFQPGYKLGDKVVRFAMVKVKG